MITLVMLGRNTVHCKHIFEIFFLLLGGKKSVMMWTFSSRIQKKEKRRNLCQKSSTGWKSGYFDFSMTNDFL